MLNQAQKFELEFNARQLTFDKAGVLWFLGPYNEIAQYNISRRATKVISVAENSSCSCFSSDLIVYGTWGGEVWAIDCSSFEINRLFVHPQFSRIAKVLVHRYGELIFCSTKLEIFGFDRKGRVTMQLPFKFAIDIVAQDDQLWILDSSETIYRWNLSTNELLEVQQNSGCLLLRNAMKGLTVGYGNGLTMFDRDGCFVERINGSFNNMAWDNKSCVLCSPNQDRHINLTKFDRPLQQLDCYSVSNCDSVVSIEGHGFLISRGGELLVYTYE
jgi:hypothetical protein